MGHPAAHPEWGWVQAWATQQQVRPRATRKAEAPLAARDSCPKRRSIDLAYFARAISTPVAAGRLAANSTFSACFSALV
jgi:hypothetical protein